MPKKNNNFYLFCLFIIYFLLFYDILTHQNCLKDGSFGLSLEDSEKISIESIIKHV